MTLSDMLNLILSTITIFIAALALILTYKQIKLSNKQHLFDRRLDNYATIFPKVCPRKSRRAKSNTNTIGINCSRLRN